MKKKYKIFIGVLSFAFVLLIGGGIVWYSLGPAIDENNLPLVVEAHAIQPDDLEGISKFRSGAGHDFSANGETCRSMKHYFMPKGFTSYTSKNTQGATEYFPPAPTPDTAVKIFSPVTGTITKIQSEQYPIGKQIHIRSDKQKNITFRLFHVYPLENIREGADVTAGQHIGEISMYQQTDIAVQVRSRSGEQFLSYFDVMPNALFEDYQKHGLDKKSAVVITQVERDNKPLTCNGEQFTSEQNQNDWINLN